MLHVLFIVFILIIILHYFLPLSELSVCTCRPPAAVLFPYQHHRLSIQVRSDVDAQELEAADMLHFVPRFIAILLGEIPWTCQFFCPTAALKPFEQLLPCTATTSATARPSLPSLNKSAFSFTAINANKAAVLCSVLSRLKKQNKRKLTIPHRGAHYQSSKIQNRCLDL